MKLKLILMCSYNISQLLFTVSSHKQQGHCNHNSEKVENEEQVQQVEQEEQVKQVEQETQVKKEKQVEKDE